MLPLSVKASASHRLRLCFYCAVRIIIAACASCTVYIICRDDERVVTLSMMDALQLPYELVSQILSYVSPQDLVRFGRTCRYAHSFTHPSNIELWRVMFLKIFDDPYISWSLIQPSQRQQHIQEVQQKWNWCDELKRRLLALQISTSENEGLYGDRLMDTEHVISTVLDIIDTAKPGPTEEEMARGVVQLVDDRRSLNLQIVTGLIAPCSKLEDLIHDSPAKQPAEDEVEEERELAGRWFGSRRMTTRSMSSVKKQTARSDAAKRLHVLYGQTGREKVERGVKGLLRRIVYSWDTPNLRNEYGPFKDDNSGVVDWTILEAASAVILSRLELCVDGRLAIPSGFVYSIPHRNLVDPTMPEDWARVSGVWVGTYSFIDYTDFYHYNTWDDEPSRPSLEDVAEACGELMRLQLKLDESLQNDPRLQTQLPECEDLPALFFSGTSSSYENFGDYQRTTSVRGRVSLCPGGKEVRWRYIINYSGQDQWQLEGVQPGGIRSGPVYGLWTQWGHDEGSPCGSFMYIPEVLCKRTELVLLR